MSKDPELYVKENRPGEFICYEKNPIPGGVDMATVHRDTAEQALEDGREYLARRGSAFKAERSVVGA